MYVPEGTISVRDSDFYMYDPNEATIIVKPRENSNFLKNCKMVISIKIRNFSRLWMTKQTSQLESSRKI